MSDRPRGDTPVEPARPAPGAPGAPRAPGAPQPRQKVILALEDGRAFFGYAVAPPGRPRWAPPVAQGELVFCTAMTGYQEVCSDPSYRGQLVVLKQAAHGLLTESPEVTAASMMDFLSDLGKEDH